MIQKLKHGYLVTGLAMIKAGPGIRSMYQAKGFAERIEKNPAEYLAAIAEVRVPGITDLRETTKAIMRAA